MVNQTGEIWCLLRLFIPSLSALAAETSQSSRNR
jgi:hypothetical protein